MQFGWKKDLKTVASCCENILNSRWFRNRNKIDKEFEEINNYELPENLEFVNNNNKDLFAS